MCGLAFASSDTVPGLHFHPTAPSYAPVFPSQSLTLTLEGAEDTKDKPQPSLLWNGFASISHLF